MGIIDTFKNMFGADRQPLEEKVADSPSIAELLAPTKVMEQAWAKAARADAREFSGETRAQLGREFGAQWFPNALPSESGEREAEVEQRLLARSRGLYADHVEQVEHLFDRPDEEVRYKVMSDIEDLPGRDRPLDRALAISTSLISDQTTMDVMDQTAKDFEQNQRLYPSIANDWSEHKAGEPSVLAAERDGDWEHVDAARRSFSDTYRLTDPTLREIAVTVVDVSDSWEIIDAEAMASGTVRMGLDKARQLRSSAVTYEPGHRRDAALVEAYLDEHVAINPKGAAQWDRQALEVMSEGPAFMQARYGVETTGMSARQVVSLEAMHAVKNVRREMDVMERANDRGMDVVRDRSVGQASSHSISMAPHAMTVQDARSL